MTLFNFYLNPPFARLFRFRLSGSIITLLALCSPVLPGCIHINVTERTAESRDFEEQTISQDSARNEQDPMSPRETVEPLSSDPSAIPSALLGGSECRLDNLVNHRQQTGSWCWAGSTLTAIEFIKKLEHQDDDQCNFVNTVFSSDIERINSTRTTPTPDNEAHCCKATRDMSLGTPGVKESRRICDNGLWPKDALSNPRINTTFLEVFYPPPPLDDVQGWEDLTGQICRGLPYLTVVKWAGGGRHAIAIGGYSSLPSEGEYVHVYDPGQEGFYLLMFQDFYNGIPGKFSHEMDYFNIGQ